MLFLRPVVRYFRLLMCLFLSVLFHPLFRIPDLIGDLIL